MSNPIIEAETRGKPNRERSFALSHIALRAIWNVVWLVLASWTPPQMHAWRRFLLNLFGARIAKGARVYGSARVWYPPNLEMGKGAVLGWRSFCYSQDKVVIGEYATVSQFTHIITGTHDTENPELKLYTKPVVIQPYAWVTANCIVGPGVSVGEGAVLGAGGVAFKSLEPWTVYVGNPAQRVRDRRKFAVKR